MMVMAFLILSGCQSSSKLFYSRKIANGMLYYHIPVTWYHSSVAKCEVDQTIVSTEDFVRVGVSLFTKEVIKVDSVSFNNTSLALNAGVTPLFVEKTKGLWHCRFFISLPKAKLMEFFSGTPPNLCFFVSDKKLLCLEVKEKQWIKISQQNKEFYYIVQLN